MAVRVAIAFAVAIVALVIALSRATSEIGELKELLDVPSCCELDRSWTREWEREGRRWREDGVFFVPDHSVGVRCRPF